MEMVVFLIKIHQQLTLVSNLEQQTADVVGGIGAGVEVNGLATLNLENDVVSGVMQYCNAGDDDLTDGGWISQAYLTYGIG